MNRRHLVSAGLLAGLVLALSTLPSNPGSAAETAVAPLVIELSGAGEPFAVTPEVLRSMRRHSVSAPASEHAPDSSFEGVDLRELLTRAGVPLGDAVRGEPVGWAVVADAADGYRALYALAEIDPTFTDKRVIVADRRDGAPLAADEGPLRLVAAGEKRPGRSVRQVNRIRVGAVRMGEEGP